LDPPVEPEKMTKGYREPEALDLSPIKAFAERLEEEVKEWDDEADRDELEGRAASDFYHALRHVPIEVLDDPGFWRYLSIALFWDFIAWREEEPFESGNYLKYVNGRSNTEAVLNRMYMRAKAVGEEHLHLANALEKSADFWRSHIIRVRTGTAPPLARSFVRMQRDDRLMTSQLRHFARELNRNWSNIELHLYDDEAASELLSDLRDDFTE